MCVLTQCVLVKGWSKGASWTFPKGKINQDEPERDCALREVREETGVDASHLLPPDSRDYLELTMREQKVRLYIVPGLSEDTPMETQTRREISVRQPPHSPSVSSGSLCRTCLRAKRTKSPVRSSAENST